ncbi:hypothetical protein [Nocardia neocaledoniensis]|uniref:hypothetical protein n=1 Tax=Nocardia neocaledoniensis TaxID=236511 RepID=UPI0024547787|nr:hypothetical protein [Nocardia neocaledoniensis]
MTHSTEKPKITDDIREHADQFEHWDIYRSFNPLDPNAAQSAAQDYWALANGWNNAVEYFAARIKHSSTAAWEGPAAEASRTAITNYAARALELSPALSALASEVTVAANSIVTTKQSVDEPQNGRDIWDLKGKIADWVTDGPRSRDEIDRAKTEAREAMQTHYIDKFKVTDGKIPVFPTAVSPVDPLYSFDPSSDPGGTPSDGGGNPTTPTATNPSATSPTTDQPATTDDPTTTEDDTDDDSTDDPSSADPDTGDSTEPSSTDPESPATNPAATNPAAAGAPGSGSPGGGTGGGGAGSPGAGTPSAPAPGKGMPGTPLAAGVTAAGLGTAAANSGRGMAGMGGMGAPGARGGGKDDESTHEIPEWLRNMENTEELLGETPKTLPGGVIGLDL